MMQLAAYVLEVRDRHRQRLCRALTCSRCRGWKVAVGVTPNVLVVDRGEDVVLVDLENAAEVRAAVELIGSGG